MLPFPATQPKNLMVSAGARSKDYDKSRYISILNIIQARGQQRVQVLQCYCSASKYALLRWARTRAAPHFRPSHRAGVQLCTAVCSLSKQAVLRAAPSQLPCHT